ncbi:MAG: hypothetical protein K8S55_12345 [Phycisphaerae bacterium]|nr:hypothetical protein [Phycisphaerae bacterium]
MIVSYHCNAIPAGFHPRKWSELCKYNPMSSYIAAGKQEDQCNIHHAETMKEPPADQATS